MKYPTLSLVTIALMTLGFTSVVAAENINFQLGFEAPAYTAETSLQTQDGWSVNHENPDGVFIRGSASDITPPEGSQMLEITRQVGAEIPVASRVFTSVREAITGNLTFSFLSAADVASNAAFKIGIGSSFETQTGAWVSLRRAVSGDGFGLYYWDGNEKSWNQIGNETIPLGEFIRFEVAVNAETMTFSVKVLSIDGQLLAEKDGIPLWDVGGHLAAGKGFNRIVLSADQHGATRFYLDDIKVQSTP